MIEPAVVDQIPDPDVARVGVETLDPRRDTPSFALVGGRPQPSEGATRGRGVEHAWHYAEAVTLQLPGDGSCVDGGCCRW